MSSGRVVLVGVVHECLAAFDALVGSADSELVGVVTLTTDAASKVSGSVDIATIASAHDVPVVRVRDVNSRESIDSIAALRPDAIAVVGWTRLIGDELLALPTRGCVGFHASLLPRNRGRAPVNWAIIRGEDETGNTMMLLNAGVDTGQIIDQRRTPIGPDDTCRTVYERVAALGAEMLRDNMGPFLRGEIAPRAQDESSATLLPKRVPSMGVTDWTRTARQVHDWIRAQTGPYPGAFTHVEGTRVPLWRSTIIDEGRDAGEPGEILAIEESGVLVAAGRGVLLLTELGPSDTDVAGPRAWAESLGVRPGVRFDQPSAEWIAWSLGAGPRPEELH